MDVDAVPGDATGPSRSVALRVFLVDDLLSTRRLIEDLFAALGGFTLVGSATSEGEAKLWLDENPDAWDLAVIDLVLEAGSGMGVVLRCRQRHPAGAVVVFSAYSTQTLRDHCIELGASAVFHKDETEAFVAWLRAAAGMAANGPGGPDP